MQESEWTGWQRILDATQLKVELTALGLDSPVVDALVDCARRIAGVNSRVEELGAFVCWFRADEGSAPVIEGEPLLAALAYIACLPELFSRQRRRGIDESVSKAAAIDLQRWIYNYQRANGEWGLSDKVSRWFRSFLFERTITLGRLQFSPGIFGLAHVYRRDADGDVIALARDGAPCVEDGWPVSEGKAFVTTFSDDGQTIVGHPFRRSNGSIEPEAVVLEGSGYTEVLSPTTPVLFIHIPEGPAMTPAACGESIEWAQSFFPRHYPEVEWKALVCVSWLVDPELLKVTPDGSNIASFVQRFVPLTHLNANDDQLWERVFGGRIDTESFIPQSSLQKAILAHIRNGGRFRHTGGFIPESLR